MSVDPATLPAAPDPTLPDPRDAEIEALKAQLATATAPAAAVTVYPKAPEASVYVEGFVSSKPLLMIGAAGPDVAELAHLLAEHGYSNAIADGAGGFPATLDDALMAQVVDFQQANGIDPWGQEPGDGINPVNPPILRRDHSGVVEARTWEALLGYAPVLKREGARS